GGSFELVGLRRHALGRNHIGHALDRASAIRWTRGVSHPSGSADVPALEARLHPGDRTRRNGGSPTVPPAAPIGRCDPACPRLASPRGLLWPSLVPRSLSGSGVVNERDRLRRLRRGPRRREDGRLGCWFPRSLIHYGAHGVSLRPEV